MRRPNVRSVGPHRFLKVKGLNRTRSVEMSRCYEMWNVADQPSHNVPLSVVAVPAKETLSDTHYRLPPWARLVCMIDGDLSDQHRGNERVIPDSFRLQ